MNLPATLDPDDLITLKDGTTLDQRQSKAILAHVMTDMTNDEIAEQAGYASGGSVWTFLNSARGRMGVEVAMRQHLLEGARVGLKTMVKLAREAKSETVRQLAAADLMNRADLRVEAAEAGPKRGGNGFSININMGDGQGPVTIEGESI